MRRPSPNFRSEEYFVYEISEKMFNQIYRDLYADAMLVTIRMSTNMADGNQQKQCYRVLLQKREFILRGTHKH